MCICECVVLNACIFFLLFFLVVFFCFVCLLCLILCDLKRKLTFALYDLCPPLFFFLLFFFPSLTNVTIQVAAKYMFMV